MMKFHWINKKLFITTSSKIKINDLYLDSLVHPKLINFPLVMMGYADNENNIIQSYSGTTSPVKTSRKILIIIG